MFILAVIKRNCRKSRFIQEQRRLLKKKILKNVVFNEKDFIVYKYICKMYIFEDIK